jgi:antirestriction protein ArdC
MNTITENRQDVYTRITSAILAELEKGILPLSHADSTDK